MNKLMVTCGIVAALYLPVALADDHPQESDSAKAGTYVKDSVITAKVKTKLAEKHLATLTNIQVDTDNHGVVWLSGKVPTQDASAMAAMIAKNTEGVTSVHNEIEIAD